VEKGPGVEYLGKYKVNKVIGYGSMGIVYECRDPQFQRTVAVKVLHSHLLDSVKSDEYLQRFKNEIQASGSLSHPNIVTVYDADFTARPPYLVMEFVQGVELTNLIQGTEPIDLERVYSLITDILRGLKEIHNAGVIHRDLKPSNIFITKDNIAKIADFGVARVDGSELTQIGDVIGSPKYMSPEQCMGDTLDPRSDIFTVGAILFELLTGESCFSGNSYTAVANRIVSTPAPLPSQHDPSLKIFDGLIKKALAKEPAKRFQSVAEFIAELEKVIGDVLYQKTVKLHRVGRTANTGSRNQGLTRLRSKTSRKSLLIASSAAVVVAFALFLLARYDIQISTGENGDRPLVESDQLQQPGPSVTQGVIKRQELRQEPEKLQQQPEEEAVVPEIDTGIAKLDEAGSGSSKPPLNSSTQLELNKQEKIWRLLKLADTYLNLERLLFPRGSNALDSYKAVLLMEPDNERALEGIARVKSQVVERIQFDIDQQNFGNARQLLSLARTNFPQDEVSWDYFDIKLSGEKE